MGINDFSLKEATNFMGILQDKGYDCWFKTVANKDKKTLEVHIIVEDKFTIIL